MSRLIWLLVPVLAALPAARGDDLPSSEPKPIPATRPEMKRALEALKYRQPRLPLPPVEEGTGWPTVNNGRMRAYYLPPSWQVLNWGQDPAMTLDYVLVTECFWITSRGNNCHYCLGHQEHKLSVAGLSDNRLALLDSDWSTFSPRERAAYALARKLTLEPYAVQDADIEKLRGHFSDQEVVGLVLWISLFNSMNRWTDALGIPQDHSFRGEPVQFDAPTAERFAACPSVAAPHADRELPPLEPRETVEACLSACRARSPRVALLGEDDVRSLLPPDRQQGAIPTWVRALAYYPKMGLGQVACIEAVALDGRLPPLIKAQLAWVSARHNRAWYALDHARARLLALGCSDDEIWSLGNPEGQSDPALAEALRFAAKLTATPYKIADADIARLRSHYSDHETAEMVFVVCTANLFDRFTAALGLPCEPQSETAPALR